MVVVLGVLAAICYGTSDFVGGLTSRRAGAVSVLAYSYPVGALLMLALLPAFPGQFGARALLFGVLGGISGLAGVATLYRLMADAPMNVVSPVSAVLAAIVPVVVGVAVGERPKATAWLGMALGLVAVVLVSRAGEDNPHGPVSARVLGWGAFAGLGFGGYYVFLARAGSDSGLWPLVVSRLVAALLILPAVVPRRSWAGVPGRLVPLVCACGVLDALANMCFLVASRHGLLSLAGVLTSLYPAVTVVLALGLLHEHTSRTQRGGLGLAALAVVLITV